MAEEDLLSEDFLSQLNGEFSICGGEVKKGNFNDKLDAIYSEVEKAKQKRQAPRCTICNAEKPSVCGRCGASAYCSAECQQADWPLHKLLCKAYKPFLATRPNTRHRVGLRFPVLGQMPSLVWVPFEIESDLKEEIPGLLAIRNKAHTNLRLLMGADYEEPEYWIGHRNLKRNFGLPYRMVANFLKAASSQHASLVHANNSIVYLTQELHASLVPANNSIVYLTQELEDGKDRKTKLPIILLNTLSGGFWRGPVIVTREVDVGGKYTGPVPYANGIGLSFYAAQELQQQDMTLADLRHAVDCFEKLPQLMTGMKYPDEKEGVAAQP